MRLDKKRLSLLLRDALKIKSASGDTLKEDAKNESKAGDAANPPKKAGKKRGAPPGHRGATRRTPEKADNDHVVPPPESCERGCGEIIIEDDFDDKFIEDFKGIVVCDFYAAYNVIKRTHRCLVHLLGDIKKEREVLKGSKSLEKLDRRIRDFISKGKG